MHASILMWPLTILAGLHVVSLCTITYVSDFFINLRVLNCPAPFHCTNQYLNLTWLTCMSCIQNNCNTVATCSYANDKDGLVFTFCTAGMATFTYPNNGNVRDS